MKFLMYGEGMGKWIQRLEEIGNKDAALVGGKNASLGEMIRSLKKQGVRVPPGFATTADFYWEYLKHNDLKPRISERIEKWEKGKASLKQTGKGIRNLIMKGEVPSPLKKAALQAYRDLGSPKVAVRSSATAEDLPSASFAGQMETYLNIKGEKNLIEALQKCLASLFTDRAISYRREKGFDPIEIALSVGVQKMVRADKAGAGVIFTIDTETGFPDVVMINAVWGLGELVVKGVVDPDQYLVFKPLIGKKGVEPIVEKKIGKKLEKLGASGKRIKCSKRERESSVLSDDEILKLARWAKAIEKHYGRPMDIEWAKDGNSGELYIVQARPETVQAEKSKQGTIHTYSIKKKGKVLVKGSSIGTGIAAGKAVILKSAKEIGQFKEGAILVTEATDPDWVPIMKMASGIVTDHGGRTSHAAIVSRELGLPAIVGTGEGAQVLKNGQEITLSCAEGETGFVYEGIADYSSKKVNLQDLEEVKVEIMLNMADPGAALSWWKLPAKGIGLARMEFIITNHIEVHPMALARWDKLQDKDAKKKIAGLTNGYERKEDFFIEKLASGIAKIAISQWPHPTIVRMSDFKTNEYAQLIGGKEFEPDEENPMLGWRGASRYDHPDYREGFALECKAIKKAREKIGMRNLILMVPFCRTVEEADSVLRVLSKNGLRRGVKGLQIYVMCEIPSNVILAEEFADRFDGFSIGSNDLTQLVLGVDRDSDRVSSLFDERNPAVKKMIESVIRSARKQRCKIGICGQAPSDYPEFARFLVECGIDSISVSPDSFLMVHQNCKEAE